MRRERDDWNELARREPYYAVLTEDRFLGELDEERRRAFFATGERDVDFLRALIRDHLDPDFRPARVLDFGCGVGRLTLPLAAIAPSVAGVDLSEQMLEIARRNAQQLGIRNVTFANELAGERFDFIVSLIVFQHIPLPDGLAVLEQLLRMLAPGGVAALHFTLRREGGMLRRAARRLRASIPALHHLALAIRGDALRLPYMQMNAYDSDEIRRRIVAAAGVEPIVVPRHQGDIEGAIFLVRKPPGAPAR